MADFDRFLEAAHAHGMRVIADLVVNHTSDQHPWFQAARRSPDSPYRHYYVWSDTDERYRDARIIFLDTEQSNWTWDPVAKAYYWHRFFHHQPDLNYDNPQVRRELLDVMRFWLDKGLDGFRCDAVPYLFEREGTNCENLPETHEFLREIRATLDREYEGRVLLAEANQWPADVRPYFGDGDEFHMAFHFPLMPRIFLAVRHGDRRPITDIFVHTPEIPPSAQWCLFLRNHDELTLEMVSDEERHHLYYAYGSDPRMRLNLGIRRRLAPLLENDRRKIELLTSLLFTLPGSPILYYGDEIGMGDNIYLGDRNGVRTPMQWTGDRNAGFSRADTARLYLPLIVDPVYGYQSINVEAQQRTPSSLLNWLKRLIEVRKKTRVFGRGTLHFLRPANETVLAHVREYEGQSVIAVHNLAGSAQPVELDLRAWRGHTPIEMLGDTRFPTIGTAPYFISLAPYGYYWFRLEPPFSDQPRYGIEDSPL
jgi:maltose alpha-D-glucosyltransferase/alpha-amylase